jgi:hypothetical protein
VSTAAVPEDGARAGEQAETRPRLWHRIPTPIVVAVLGIVVGSWLIPALTRQWDDRQKANEVRASVAYEAASATARALTDAQEASVAGLWKGSSRPSTSPAAKEWAVASLRIQARFQTYFGREALERWQLVSRYVSTTLSLAYGDAAGVWAEAIGEIRSPSLEEQVRRYWDNRLDGSALAAAILAEQEDVTQSIITMHVRGYSTTWRDVVSDLFPGI